MKTLNIATLCSGIGSPELGAMRVFNSVNVVAACELDKFARQSYEANFSIEPKDFHNDVTKMDGRPYRGADALVGGFPCQAFSVAGKRLGFEDTRGTIFYDCVRILKEIQPKVFIFENVKGLVGHDKEGDSTETICSFDLFGGKTEQKTVTKGKKYFSLKVKDQEIGRTLHTMEQVLNDTGYFWSWRVLNTKDFGVPQNRERIFMVGFKSEEDFRNFSFPVPFELEKRLKDVLEDVVDDKYFLSDKMLEGFKQHKQHKQRHSYNGNGFGFSPLDEKSEVSKTILDSSKNYQTDNYVKVLGNTSPSGNGMNGDVISIEGVSSTLTTNKGEGTKIAGMLNIKGNEQIRRVHETGGGSPKSYDHAGWSPRTEDYSKGFP